MNIKLFTASVLFTVGIALCAGGAAQQAEKAKPAAKSTAADHQKAAETKPDKTSSPLVLDTPRAKASYAIGMTIGKNLARESVDVDTTIFMRGLSDATGGGKLLLTDEEARNVIATLQQESRAKHEAELKTLGDANKKEGEAFLAENKKKDGVVTLASGLQYKIIKQGDGPKPVATDTVECNYRGTLINGKEFDSSYKRGQPATFPVGGVIKGWTEILQLMPVGSHYQIFVPSELAYGSKPASADIGPNATLIFDVELLSIKEKPTDAAAPGASKPAQPSK